MPDWFQRSLSRFPYQPPFCPAPSLPAFLPPTQALCVVSCCLIYKHFPAYFISIYLNRFHAFCGNNETKRNGTRTRTRRRTRHQTEHRTRSRTQNATFLMRFMRARILSKWLKMLIRQIKCLCLYNAHSPSLSLSLPSLSLILSLAVSFWPLNDGLFG